MSTQCYYAYICSATFCVATKLISQQPSDAAYGTQSLSGILSLISLVSIPAFQTSYKNLGCLTYC